MRSESNADQSIFIKSLHFSLFMMPFVLAFKKPLMIAHEDT